MKVRWLLLVLLVASQADATTYYVGKSGSNANSCSTAQSSTAGNRKLTIAAGVACLSAGDTLIVGNGTYSEELVDSIPSGSAGAGYTTIKAENNQLAIISATTSDGTDTSAVGHWPIHIGSSQSYITIDGFKLSGGENSIEIYPSSNHLQILNNYITLGYVSGIKGYRCSNCLIDNNTVTQNSRKNFPRGTAVVNGQSWGSGITLVLSSDSTFSNNKVYWNHGEGLSTFNGSSNLTFSKNIVADNWSVNLYIDHCDTCTVDRNLVYVTSDARNYAFLGGSNYTYSSGIEVSAENYGSTPILNNIVITNNVVVNSSICLKVAPNGTSTNWTNFTVANNSCFGDGNGLYIQNTSGNITGWRVKNNLVNMSNGANGNYQAVFSPNTSNNVWSNNIYKGTSALFNYNNVDYNSFANWASASGDSSSSYADPLNVDKTYIPPRLWDDAGLGAGSAVSTINLANYGLTSSSTAIDAGTNSVSSLFSPLYNGSAPDMGAFERFTMLNCEVGAVATNKIVCNAAMNLNQPVQITDKTGWTWTGGTISSVAVTGSAQLTFTLSGAYGGGASTVSYNETTGNVRDSANYGATLNNRMSALSAFTVTDNTGGPPAGSVGLSHWRTYLLQGATDTAWTAKCSEDFTNCVVAPGAKIWVRYKLRNNSGSNVAAFNVLTKWRENGGTYYFPSDSFSYGYACSGSLPPTCAAELNYIKVLGTKEIQLGTVLPNGTTLTADQLTGNETTNVSCLANYSTASIPSIALNNSSETECALGVQISGSAPAGTILEACPYKDDGTALTCSTPVKLTVGSYQSVR